MVLNVHRNQKAYKVVVGGGVWGGAKVVIVIVDRFYIALFSALEQTHCALVACASECKHGA